MNILLISQCKKNALTQTRRIIDQFAERCGDRTWQTVMTEAGLKTLHQLLRKTARKNTAIACYWTHGKNITELLWVVGNQKVFNDQGRVPTNRTQCSVLNHQHENDWQSITAIQLVTTLAALLHDLGKASVGFQNKLRHSALSKQADPFRHEWISLHLFSLMIQDCQTDEAVLQRLAQFDDYQQQHPTWYKNLVAADKIDLMTLPLLAKWIAWLIVSHHRMPFLTVSVTGNCQKLQRTELFIAGLSVDQFYQTLKAVDNWVKNARSLHPNPEQFWQLNESVTRSQPWLKKLTRYANKALNYPPLMQINEMDPFLLRISRLILMVADHNFSSLPACHLAAKDTQQLIANTNYLSEPKQCLDQHLIGVANYSANFARLLPRLATALPAITQHKAFTKRTTVSRFQWQNHAFDLAKQYQALSDQGGFFGVNMASTGCGKTLANGRILYALSNLEQGARFTVALGLRVLTLQTGKALRERLQLSEQHLAMLVGGQRTQTLFELQNELAAQELSGSESSQNLVDEWVEGGESGLADESLGVIIENSKARQLLYAPIVTCTIDHIIQASEGIRGGKYIAPTLRLLTADLILDEPDDFDQNDLPALARLVHLTGLLGRKILLSSATLTPDLIAGLFDAYQAGRKIWQRHSGKQSDQIVCGFFDEDQQSVTCVADNTDFKTVHHAFVSQRVARLMQSAIRRQGQVLTLLNYLDQKSPSDDLNYATLAKQLLEQAYLLHQHHAQYDRLHQKSLSVGLIRFAYTKDVIALVQHMYQQTDLPTDTQFHIVVYHAKQLLLLRSQLEQRLDSILDRSDPDRLFSHPDITSAINGSDKTQQIFIVISTPVSEVGRDHDYDWAIVEPSSMRSIIQLAGRVWRHRPDKVALQPNIALLGSNLKSIAMGNQLGVGQSCFIHPGFEQAPFLLTTHNTAQLVPAEQLNPIHAAARIAPCLDTNPTLAKLEHDVMADLFQTRAAKRKVNYVTGFWQTGLAHHHCVHLQLISPFRQTNRREDNYVCQLDDQGNHRFSLADIAWQTPDKGDIETRNSVVNYQAQSFDHPAIRPWLTCTVKQALDTIAVHFDEKNHTRLANEFCTVSLYADQRWHFHPYLGFYKNKG